jgi:hypothetical protein
VLNRDRRQGKGKLTKVIRDSVAVRKKPKRPGPSKKGSRTRKKVRESAFETLELEALHVLHGDSIHLDDAYDETRVVMVAVDPYLLHVYWEVPTDELDKARASLNGDDGRSRCILRFHDLSGITSRGEKACGSFDVPIDLGSGSLYIPLRRPGKSYFAELGLETQGGRFYSIIRSNVARTPSARSAPEADEAGFPVQADPRRGVSKRQVREGLPGDHWARPGNEGPKAGLSKERPQEDAIFQKSDPFRPESVWGRSVQGPSGQGAGIDLTERTEGQFTRGLSSEQGMSPPKKGDSADR